MIWAQRLILGCLRHFDSGGDTECREMCCDGRCTSNRPAIAQEAKNEDVGTDGGKSSVDEGGVKSALYRQRREEGQ